MSTEVQTVAVQESQTNTLVLDANSLSNALANAKFGDLPDNFESFSFTKDNTTDTPDLKKVLTGVFMGVTVVEIDTPEKGLRTVIAPVFLGYKEKFNEETGEFISKTPQKFTISTTKVRTFFVGTNGQLKQDVLTTWQIRCTGKEKNKTNGFSSFCFEIKKALNNE